MDSIEYLDPENINGLNLFAYCGNNPVMYVDRSGHFAISTFLIGLVIGIIVGASVGGAVYGGVSAGLSGGDVGDVFTGIGKGAVNGLIFGGSISLGIGGFVYGGTTVLGSMMATFGMSTVLNMIDVTIAQGKKSYRDGDGFWYAANDINNAVFKNSWKIIGGNLLSKATVFGAALINYDIALTLGWPATYVKAFISTLESKPHKFMLFLSYLSVAIDGISLLKTIFGNEESKRSLY